MGASSFATNPLLVKDSVGKTRPTVFDLPGKDHIYGKKVERNPEECAAQVLQHWNVKATSKHAVPALDYITMNRNTAKQGILSPRAIRDYRKEHPVRMKIGDHNLFGSDGTTASMRGENGEALTSAEARKLKLLGTLPHDNDPNFVYGMPTRPSTPVAYLMTDKYQREWIQAEAKRNALKKKSLTSKTRKILAGGGSNTTSKAIINDKPKRILIVDKDPKTLFKMSKFLKQGPKISSWRNTSTNGHDHRNESSGDEVADARLKKTVKELDEATKEVADMRIHKEIPQVITVNVPVKNEPKVRFSSGRETKPEVGNSKQLNTQIEPSPVTAKKLIAPPGAAPIGWSPSQ